jgi:hypothetical protein
MEFSTSTANDDAIFKEGLKESGVSYLVGVEGFLLHCSLLIFDYSF